MNDILKSLPGLRQPAPYGKNRLRSPGYPGSGEHVVFLYVAYCKGHAKIGLTENPRGRLSTLQVGSPFPIEMLLNAPLARDDAIQAERNTMISIAAFHSFSDWFKCPKSIALQAATTALRQFPYPDGLPLKLGSNFMEPGRVRGEWCRKAVNTPDGHFASITYAARHFKVTVEAIRNRIKTGKEGYSYVEGRPYPAHPTINKHVD
jgi:hypothetical protein